MKLLVILSSVVACAMAQVLVYNSLPYGLAHPYSYAYTAAPIVSAPLLGPVSSQFRAQDELGQFTFATAGDNQARTEIATLDGAVRGAYSYVDANGKLINVLYHADDQGFRVIGANNLPEAPAVPKPPVLRGPEPVKDTPEVIAAKAAFQKQYAEAAKAAKESPESPVSRKKRGILYPGSPFTLAASFGAHTPADTKKVDFHPVAFSYAVPHVVAAAPQVISAPAVTKATIKNQQSEPAEAAVPADTQKVENEEKEKEVTAPAPISYAAPQFVAAPHLYAAHQVVAAPQVYATHHVVAAPQIYAAPALTKTTVKYHQFEPVEASVPADTKKIELKEREQDILTPTYSYHYPLINHAKPGLVYV
ncbi:testis-specific gene A8 protein isoform X1 [Anabrus simplex]|uniref:testis-specific gene A8 protein isoform X1 n=1 Tax=Anabrus simplex TaxID=316456 RepID=UPI0035A2E184